MNVFLCAEFDSFFMLAFLQDCIFIVNQEGYTVWTVCVIQVFRKMRRGETDK